MRPSSRLAARARAVRTRFVLGGALLLLASVAAVVFLNAREPSNPTSVVVAPREHAEHVDDGAPEPSFARATRSHVEEIAAEHAASVDHAAHAAERVLVARGRVTFAGSALAGALDVLLHDADGRVLDVAATDARGAFELRAASPLETGWSVRTDDVLVAADGARRALAPDATTELAEHALDDAPVVLELDVRAPIELSGRVVDAETGAPIDAASVCARTDRTGFEALELSTRTGVDGRYRLALEGLPARGLLVEVRAEGRRPRVLGPIEAAEPERGLVDRRSTSGVHVLDVELARPLAWRGTVVSARDGRAVRGAIVTIGSGLERLDAAPSVDSVDDDGRFEFAADDVPVEGAWLHATAPGFAPVVLRAPQAGAELRIALEPPIVLSGSVRARGSDTPIAGATVHVAFEGDAERGGGTLADEVRTSADGAFELVLESAPFDAARIEVEGPEHAAFVARLADLVEFDAGRRAFVRVELSASR